MSVHAIAKYFDAFPYSNLWFDETGTFAFFLKEANGGKFLHRLDLRVSLDANLATQICDEDFNRRAFVPQKLDLKRGHFYLTSDENNRENFNFYRIHLEGGDLVAGSIEQLTFSEYMSGARLTSDFKTVYYGSRAQNSDGTFTTSLETRDLSSMNAAERLVVDADWEYRLGWSVPVVRPGTRKLLTTLDWKNRRQRKNIAEIDLETKSVRHLLPTEIENSGLFLTFEETEQDGFFFVSEHEGFENAYFFEFETSQISRLTHLRSRNRGFSAVTLENGHRAFVAAVPLLRENATEIHVIEIQRIDGKLVPVMRTRRFEGSHGLMAHRRAIWITSASMEQVPSRTELDPFTLQSRRKFVMCQGDAGVLTHGVSKFVTYRSFDGLEIPAYLTMPRSELKGAIITAFYGGEEEYAIGDQILCEQGFAILSPAVRGSWGWGEEWERKLKGDLGGNEILDVIWGAKFLEKELNLSPAQIGVEGGSHGGYAVLRALTMPQGFKGLESRYQFGFGLCWAGFADLVDFFKTSRIPDWLVDLLGPFESNEALYRERSPLTHFENLEAPLFVAHGTNDTRVSPTSMEGFLAKLRESDKPHRIHLMEGQGHTQGNREEKINYYSQQLEFLRDYVLPT